MQSESSPRRGTSKIERRATTPLQASTESNHIFSVNQRALDENGVSLYWNDVDLTVEPYDSIKKHYHCGKQLDIYDNSKKTAVYTILSIDLDEAMFSQVMSDGEIKTLFQKTSTVPHKMGVGGQSAVRFAKIRDGEITLWFKRVNEALKEFQGNITLDMNPIHQRRFMKTLHTYNQAKIVRHINSGYSGMCGVYQAIKLLQS